MIAGLNVSELIELAVLLVATGALAGFLAGIFGIGGGAVLVPVLYECFRLAGVPLEVRLPLCVGTSLAIIIPTSISAFRSQYARGRGGHGDPEAVGDPGFDRRDRGQRDRALRAGEAVQICIRRRGVVGGRAPAVRQAGLAAR